MRDHSPDFLLNDSIQELPPCRAGWLMVEQDAQVIRVERTDEPLELPPHVVVTVKPAEERSGLREIERMALDQVNDDGR